MEREERLPEQGYELRSFPWHQDREVELVRERLHHQGGSIGYAGRDYKVGFETRDVVQENQGFAWNPSITGSKSEDTMLATSAGPLILSPPVTFPTLELQVGGRAFVRPDILEK